jgi:hypothetical protein
MALGSIQKAYEIYQEHDFSRQHQIRILNMNNVPDYVIKEIIEKPTGAGGYVYATTYSVPGRTINDIQLPYQGFNFHIPGMVQYDSPNPWVINFRTPGDYLVRNALERWHFAIVSDETSCGAFHIPCADTTIDIAVISPQCTILRVYRLHGVYPQNVSPIEYNQEAVEITTFSAAFHYQYWRLVNTFDSGLIDSTASDQAQIDGVYASFESNILSNKGNCGVAGASLIPTV